MDAPVLGTRRLVGGMVTGAGPRPRQLPLPFVLPERAGATAAFFAATSNRAALAWLEAPATWPDGRLLLWGEAGLGKTHLLRAWAAARGAAHLPGPGLHWPLPLSRGIAVDDADLAAEETLLHLLNDAAASGCPVLLAAQAPPAEWPTGLPDLASRLRAVTAVQIDAAEDSLLRAILLRLCADRQLSAPEPVQEFLLLRLPRSPAALQEAAARLDRAALADGGRVTRALAAAIVDEMAAMWHAEPS